MKLSHATFRERAFALTLWRKGNIGYGIPFFQFTTEAQYDQETDTVKHKDTSFSVSEVEVTPEELEEAED